jgi:hypothetical protein
MKKLWSYFRPAVSSAATRTYVLSRIFSGVDDSFDAQALWERARSMRRDPDRLKAVLEAHTQRVGNQRQVFSHIVVELPAADVEHDRRICRGENCRTLARDLEKLHQDSFGKLLGNGATPRYVVEAAIDLADDQVRVRLGHGIYLPEADEPMAWSVESSIDGTIWNTPAARLAERQHLAVLGGSSERASFGCPGWPFAEDVSLILVNEAQQSDLAISSEPLHRLVVRKDEELACHVVESPADAAVSTVPVRLYLRLTRLAPPARATGPCPEETPSAASGRSPAPGRRPVACAEERIEPAIFAAEASATRYSDSIRMADLIRPAAAPDLASPPVSAIARADDATATLVPLAMPSSVDDAGETWVAGVLPRHPARIDLAGLAIQRLSRFLDYDIRALSFGLDMYGQVLPPRHQDIAFRFTVNPQDSLHVETREGRRRLAIHEKLPLPVGGVIGLNDLPDQLANDYLGWLPLPDGPSAPLLPGKILTAGRDRQFRDLVALQAFSGEGFITAEKDPGGDCMGISSRHCSFLLADEGLAVTALGRMPVALLAADFTFLRLLERGQTQVLDSGEYLVLGHYVWRFHQRGSAQEG